MMLLGVNICVIFAAGHFGTLESLQYIVLCIQVSNLLNVGDADKDLLHPRKD